MSHDLYPDDTIQRILKSVRTIAMDGASNNNARPSYFVLKYLMSRGYRLFPINPGLAGKVILGAPVYAKLADIPEPLDMVEIFRNSAAASGIVDEVLALERLPKVIWMQLGVRNDEAARRAEAKGIEVIMNRCPKIEYGRLSGEIGWTGVNSRILSARKTQKLRGFQKINIDRAPIPAPGRHASRRCCAASKNSPSTGASQALPPESPLETLHLNEPVAPTWTEAQRLEALESYGILDTPPEPAFDDIAKLAALTCDAPMALVSLVGKERQWFKSGLGIGMQETPRSMSICASALGEKELLVVPDLARDPRFADNPLVTDPPHVRFYAGAVLRTPDGLPLGTVCVLDHEPRPHGLKEDQAFTLRVLARQVMTQMQLRRAIFEREKALSEQEDALEAIRESEERFRVIANSAPVPIWVTAASGPREFTNFAYQEFLGVS